MTTVGRHKRNVRRIARIVEIAVRHGLGYFVQTLELGNLLPTPMRQEQFKRLPSEVAARNIRQMLEELGPTFIKIGQLLSIRPDLVPPDLVFELERLQDTVAPLTVDVIKQQIEGELSRPLDAVFARFDDEPLGSASIGQVHRAQLKDGPEVVVKVQRPAAESTVDADLDLLRALAYRVRDRVKWIDVIDVLDEFSDSLHRELDYRVEAHHIDRFRHNFRDDPLIKIPLVYWPLTTRRILVMEYVEGSKLSDLATPESLGIDTYALAEHGAEAFMRQVLEFGFFHGDLHPANILVTPDGRIGYLDFGIVGTVSEENKRIITHMLIAILRQDSDAVVREAANLGVTIPPDRLPAMRAELREILFRYYGRSLEQIRIEILGREFLAMLYRNHVRIPKDFALLAKALVTLEGVAKHLYPEFNIVEVARPYATKLVREKYPAAEGIQQVLDEIKRDFVYLAEMPKHLHDVLGMVRAGQLTVKSRDMERDRLEQRIDIAASRVSFSIVLAAVIVAMAVIVSIVRIRWMETAGFVSVLALAMVWVAVMVMRRRR